ncbi:hypothetical protein GQ53DRAFT_44556 [Thozetella sp. PMI_491]|nr:hypothetical protein GQ53DRAFT_44556 [Thozetella sp. PMI_491]
MIAIRIATLLASLGLLPSPVLGHFVLQIPASLGYDDTNEAMAPCDTFDPTTRNPVTNWPVGGSAISVITTHTSVLWDYNAALVSNTSNWIRLTATALNQTGVGFFCEPQIPGITAWIGQPVVLQVVQHAPDGLLYQCAAIQFVAGGPAATPSGCTNSSGLTAHWT